MNEAAAAVRDICARAADPLKTLRESGFADADVPDDVAVEVFEAVGASSLPLAVSLAADDRLRLAAALVGAAQAALDIGIAYARERHVFGRPVASFQVQRHAFALCAARVDAASALVRRVAAGNATPLEQAAALPVAADAAWAAAEQSLQVHGGYGYTDEYEISQRWRDIAAVRAGVDRSAVGAAVE